MVTTFVLDSDPIVTMELLDNRRLGKQRVEAKQIINVLSGTSSGWKNHPAVKSWEGYIDALKYYHDCAVIEWESRGFKNTMQLYNIKQSDVIYPEWFTIQKIHYSHMARLIQKQPSYYKEKLNVPEEYLQYGYIWPNKWTILQLETLHHSELAEKLVIDRICIKIKNNGEKCVNKCKGKSDYCGVHQK